MSVRATRIAGSGNVARWIGLGFCFLLSVALFIGMSDGTESPAVLAGMLVFVVVDVFLVVRAFFWGTYIDDERVVIASWFRTYRIPFGDIQAIYDQPYSYLLNRGSGSVTLLSSRTRVVGFELASIGRRVFPGTISSTRGQKRVLAVLEERLSVPVVRLEGWESARWFC